MHLRKMSVNLRGRDSADRLHFERSCEASSRYLISMNIIVCVTVELGTMVLADFVLNSHFKETISV